MRTLFVFLCISEPYIRKLLCNFVPAFVHLTPLKINIFNIYIYNIFLLIYIHICTYIYMRTYILVSTLLFFFSYFRSYPHDMDQSDYWYV